MTTTTYPCPLCNVPLVYNLGNVFNHNKEGYGLTMFCNNKQCKCEVFGYTRNNKPEDAYELITEKYVSKTV